MSMEDYPWFCVSTPRDAEHNAVLTTVISQLRQAEAAEIKFVADQDNRYTVRMHIQKNFKIWLPRSCFISLECSEKLIEYGVPDSVDGMKGIQGYIPDSAQRYRTFRGFTDVFGNEYRTILSSPRRIDYVFWDTEQDFVEFVVANLYVKPNRGQGTKSAEITYTKSRMSLDALPNEISSYMEKEWKTQYNSAIAL